MLEGFEVEKMAEKSDQNDLSRIEFVSWIFLRKEVEMKFPDEVELFETPGGVLLGFIWGGIFVSYSSSCSSCAQVERRY